METTPPALFEEFPDFTVLYFVKTVAFTIISVAIIIGNSLVIIAVVWSKQLANAFPSYFIINLAVTDLIVGIYVFPINIIHSAIGRFPFGHTMCIISKLITLVGCVSSVLTLCLLALDRYIVVAFPLRCKIIMTTKVKVFLIGLVWFFVFICLIGLAMITPILTAVDPTCRQTFMLEKPVSIYFACWFLAGMILMFTLHWLIYKKLSERKTIISNSLNTVISSSSDINLRIHIGGQSYPSSLSSSKLELQRHAKVVKTLFLVCGVFFLCWLPYVIFLFIAAVGIQFELQLELANVVASIGYFNSCMNPFIYAARSQSFRIAFNKLIKCRKV